MALCFNPFAGARANPTGGDVVGGSATISQPDSSTVQINQDSANAIIDWQRFSINQGETTRFVQPSSSSITLNRVIGSDASQIMGRLQANGRIILVNPAGIVFGSTARVDVAGLVATTANINNQDFMAGNYHFKQAPGTYGQVINRGQITASDNGFVALVAPSVENSGIIIAHLGKVTLASGTEYTLDMYGDQLINFTVDANAENASVTHSGEIYASGGKVALTANAMANVVENVINMSGVIEASSATQRGGVITLSAPGGGNINVAKSSVLNADGKTGGGEVTIIASDSTEFYGTIYARALESGDGGFAEVSGYNHVLVDGHANLSAANGNAGLFLIDPGSVTIQDGADAAVSMDVFNDAWIATQLDLGELVISTTNSTNGGTENLTVNGDVDITWTSGNAFSLIAGNNLTVTAGAIMNGSGASDTAGANISLTSGGDLTIEGAITSNGGAGSAGGAGANGSTGANGGNITMAGDSITISNATISSTGGTGGNGGAGANGTGTTGTSGQAGGNGALGGNGGTITLTASGPLTVDTNSTITSAGGAGGNGGTGGIGGTNNGGNGGTGGTGGTGGHGGDAGSVSLLANGGALTLSGGANIAVIGGTGGASSAGGLGGSGGAFAGFTAGNSGHAGAGGHGGAGGSLVLGNTSTDSVTLNNTTLSADSGAGGTGANGASGRINIDALDIGAGNAGNAGHGGTAGNAGTISITTVGDGNGTIDISDNTALSAQSSASADGGAGGFAFAGAAHGASGSGGGDGSGVRGSGGEIILTSAGGTVTSDATTNFDVSGSDGGDSGTGLGSNGQNGAGGIGGSITINAATSNDTGVTYTLLGGDGGSRFGIPAGAEGTVGSFTFNELAGTLVGGGVGGGTNTPSNAISNDVANQVTTKIFSTAPSSQTNPYADDNDPFILVIDQQPIGLVTPAAYNMADLFELAPGLQNLNQLIAGALDAPRIQTGVGYINIFYNEDNDDNLLNPDARP